MKLDWSAISKIVSIPLSWFRDVDRRSNIIGDGQYLDVDKNSPDGTVLSLNIDAVAEYIGGGASGVTGAMTVVTDVQWNGASLLVFGAQITISDGRIVGIGSTSLLRSIDTVVYTG